MNHNKITNNNKKRINNLIMNQQIKIMSNLCRHEKISYYIKNNYNIVICNKKKFINIDIRFQYFDIKNNLNTLYLDINNDSLKK